MDAASVDFGLLSAWRGPVCGHVGYPWTEEMVAVAPTTHALDGVDDLGLTHDAVRDCLHGNAERVFTLGR